MTKRKVHAEDAQPKDEAVPGKGLVVATPRDATSTRLLEPSGGAELAVRAASPMSAPMGLGATTHSIQTTMRPDVTITVSDLEYQQLLAAGLVYSGSPVAPVADSYDLLFADKVQHGTATPAALRAAFVSQATAAKSGFRAAALVTDGTFARTQPAPGGNKIHPLQVDPNRTGTNGTGRLWGWRETVNQFGFTDDDGATWTDVGALPSSLTTYTPVQIEFSTNFMWLLVGVGTTSLSGQLWRSPLPAADGTGIAWTKVFDLSGMSSGPGGSVTSAFAGTTFRNQSFAIQPDESKAYLLDYASGSVTSAPATSSFTDGMIGLGSDLLYSTGGAATFKGYLAATGFPVTIVGAGAGGANLVTTIKEVLSNKLVKLTDPAQTAVSAASVTIGSGTLQSNIWGGPSVYTSLNPGGASASITWGRTSTWAYAKHGHAIKLINGIPWVALGDVGWPSAGWGVYTGPQQLGLWAATSSAANAFSNKFGQNGGLDCINFYPVNINGTPCIVAESDDTRGLGPVAFPMQDQAAQNGAGIPLHRPPFPYVGTMRALTFLPDGTMLYILTGEQAGKQPLDTIIMSAAPYDTCVILDSAPVGTIYNTVLGNGLASNGYAWFGSWRVKVPAWKS